MPKAKNSATPEHTKLLEEIEELRAQLAARDARIVVLERERDAAFGLAQRMQESLDAAEKAEAGLVHALSEKDLGKVRRLAPHMLMNRFAHVALSVKYPPQPPRGKGTPGRPKSQANEVVIAVHAAISSGRANSPREAISQLVKRKFPGRSNEVIERKVRNDLRTYQRHVK